MTIWSFRKAFGEAKELKEIEYLVFACFWGTLLVTTYVSAIEHFDVDHLNTLLGNPFASGLIFSLWGLLIGGFSGLVNRRGKVTERFIGFLKFLEKKILDE